jgi:hypothetical protein
VRSVSNILMAYHGMHTMVCHILMVWSRIYFPISSWCEAGYGVKQDIGKYGITATWS